MNEKCGCCGLSNFAHNPITVSPNTLKYDWNTRMLWVWTCISCKSKYNICDTCYVNEVERFERGDIYEMSIDDIKFTCMSCKRDKKIEELLDE